MPLLFRISGHVVGQDVQFLDGSGAQAVDEQGDFLTLSDRHIAQQGVQGLLGDLVRGLEGPFQTPGSPWMPMPMAISFSPSSKLAGRPRGMMQGVRAKPTVRVLSLAS